MSSEMAVLILIALVVALWVIVLGRVERRAKARRRVRLEARPVLTEGEWYARHYAPLQVDANAASTLVSRLASLLGCHMTQIYATDSFAQELGLDYTHPLLLGDADDDKFYFHEVCVVELLGSQVSPENLEYVKCSSTVGELLLRMHEVRCGTHES